VYDDNGFPKPNFDEELGMGFVREDGRKVASSGTWSYRERWKRAQYVQAKHGRFNALSDEQCCCWGHILPGESFLGFWRPCEIGYYNYDKNRDNIDFYGSLEGYAAYNPARQMGMIPEGIGMASPQTGEKLASDSRGMCLLAFLHDQNVGSNSNSEVGERRDAKVIAELTRAKNRFRQWEKGVDFVGYWESERCVRSSDKDVRISLYTHPERAMLFLGNVGKGLSDATVTPNWKALNLNPKQLVVTNAESGDRIPLESDAIEIAVPRHDLRILLVSPAP
jgi:hypothetical protein